MRKDFPPRPTKPGRQRRIAGTTQGRHVDDPYIARHKASGPTVCPQCGSVFHEGRWRWGPAPKDASEAICPACHRAKDEYPAGIVTLHSGVVQAKHDEIMSLIYHQEALEKAEHPLNRIIAIEETSADTLTITTTDIHLPRRIGQAIERAYHGRLALHYDEDSYFVRVDWSRPD